MMTNARFYQCNIIIINETELDFLLFISFSIFLFFSLYLSLNHINHIHHDSIQRIAVATASIIIDSNNVEMEVLSLDSNLLYNQSTMKSIMVTPAIIVTPVDGMCLLLRCTCILACKALCCSR